MISMRRRIVGSYSVFILLLLVCASPAGILSSISNLEKAEIDFEDSAFGVEQTQNEESLEETVQEETVDEPEQDNQRVLEYEDWPNVVPTTKRAELDFLSRDIDDNVINPGVGAQDEQPPVDADTVLDGGCGKLNSFMNKTHLKEYILEKTEEVEDDLWWIYQLMGPIPLPSGQFGLLGGFDSPGARGFSETNNQVAGVDEPDIVKTDGEYVYVLTGERVVILKGYPGATAKVISTIDVGWGAKEIFITSTKLVIFQSAWGWMSVLTYDITVRSTPVLLQNVTVDGWYYNSRLIGDYVYVVVNDYLSVYYDKDLELPVITNNGKSKPLSASEICYFGESEPSYGIALILSISLKDLEVRYKAYLIGGTANMYVSMNNIYIAGINYDNLYVGLWQWYWEEETIVHKISIYEGSISYVAKCNVSGWILNQFSMDEYKRYFRIATTEGHAWAGGDSESNIYVLNSTMEIIGELNGLGHGEQIYSARFMATRCYLVTFKKIDPFYVIDLTDPHNPSVLGELKLPGYSDYLHPYDVNHVIGLGKDAVDVGDFAWYQGVKLSLFDVTDLANPKEISNYSIGDRGTSSEALFTHKAFLFSKDKDLLVIPIDLYEIDESEYPGEIPPNTMGKFIWQGAYVFSITIDDGFVLKGRISHSDHLPGYKYQHAEYFVKRSLYIEDEIFTISDKTVKINRLDNLNLIKEVEL